VVVSEPHTPGGMVEASGSSESIWMATAPKLDFPPLESDLRSDVCVIGAGIAGLTTAYLLARAGRDVTVVDLGRVGGQETPRTTAHLTHAIDDRYVRLERLHGVEGARLAAESQTAAIDRIEAIVRAEGIDCDFERLDGYLFLQPDDTPELLDEELEAARRAGLGEVERLDRAPLPSFDTGPCLRFPRQAQFHPLAYLGALCEAIGRDGGRIFGDTRVVELDSSDTVRVRTAAGREIAASAVVVATNSPISERFAVHAKQAPYRTYVIALETPTGAVPRGLYWDSGFPYHYVRLASMDSSEFLIVGGEDHKSGQADDEPERYGRIEAWARERFPEAGRIAYRWSGQVMEPADGLAFIGRMGGDNVYVVSGDSGQGMTHGTIAGMLISDQILGRENPWAELYDPGRVTIAALPKLLKENLNVAGRFAAWVTPGDRDAIPRGSGAVVRRGLAKIAVYRDEDGVFHERSAACTHLGCVVAWNPAESAWDCPCHGSRYDAYGRVTHGPAVRDLSPPED
jgi:glycine/D-amino acid oxidase-like deaminating enzyme/nitrite reductase/ring-hydroxylating ferredoxin subunit